MNLTDYEFKDDTVRLHCRKCGELIEKTLGHTFKMHCKLPCLSYEIVSSSVPVKFGVCRKYSHGASIVKA